MEKLEQKDFTTSRDFKYHYYISPPSQTAEKPTTLLFFHGWPTSSQLWCHVIPLLLCSPSFSDKYRVVVPDLLGYGLTSKPTDLQSYNSHKMVTDLHELLTHESVGNDVIPIGHDFGSWLAQRFYLFHPKICRSLILLSVAYMPPRLGPAPMTISDFLAFTEQAAGYPRFDYFRFFTSPTAPETFRKHLSSLYTLIHGAPRDMIRKYYATTDAFKTYLLNDVRTPVKPYAQPTEFRDAFLAQFQGSDAFEAPQCWYRAHVEGTQYHAEKVLTPEDIVVKVPVLFVGCKDDAVATTDAINMPRDVGLIPDLTVKELDCAHYCPYEKPEEVVGEILGFLKEKKVS